MMDSILFGIYGFIGVIFLMMSVALYGIGNVIQEHPVGGVSKNGWSSPSKSTKSSIVLMWFGYILSLFIIMSGNSSIYFICAIVVITGAVLFALTACIFSLAVLKTMDAHKLGN